MPTPNANPTVEQLMARIQELEAKNAKLSKAPATTLKVTEKGGVSLYGIGRFPVTLYGSQWAKVIEIVKSGKLEGFLTDNKAALSVKE